MTEEVSKNVKIVGDWIATETCKRKYPKEEIQKLSDALVYLYKLGEVMKGGETDAMGKVHDQ